MTGNNSHNLTPTEDRAADSEKTTLVAVISFMAVIIAMGSVGK